METGSQAKAVILPDVCERKLIGTTPKASKAECVFSDGTSILVSSLLASVLRTGDEILFPVDVAGANTEIFVRRHSKERTQDVFQAQIGCVSQPRRDKRGSLFVSAEVLGRRLGISAVNLRCEALRDHFFAANRRQPWSRQPSLYELLRVGPKVSPTDLRVAFKLRMLELRAERAPVGEVRGAERAFNILAHPELRACFEALVNDPSSAAVFPHGGFGSLIVAGERSREGSVFFASRVLSFVPERKFRDFAAPLRRFEFQNEQAIYRDPRRKLEISFDRASLPLAWDASWNRWKHFLRAKIGLKATFVQNGGYRRRGTGWQLVTWESAVPSRIEVALPAGIGEHVIQARDTYHRLGQLAEPLDQIRARIDSAPVEMGDLAELCAKSGISDGFDIALITWKPEYEPFYYDELRKRARRVFLFRSEYIFDLEKAVVVEKPLPGHAAYFFAKPLNMSDFLALYTTVTRKEILQNRRNVAERLGFLGCLVHGRNLRAWLEELSRRLSEPL